MIVDTQHTGLSSTEQLAALLRGWEAIDIETGAHLGQTHGLGKGGLPTFILILPDRTPNERGGLFNDPDWTYPTGRKRIRARTLREAIELANKKLEKMLKKRSP